MCIRDSPHAADAPTPILPHAVDAPMPLRPNPDTAPTLILHLTLVGMRGGGEVMVGPWFGSCSVTEFGSWFGSWFVSCNVMVFEMGFGSCSVTVFETMVHKHMLYKLRTCVKTAEPMIYILTGM